MTLVKWNPAKELLNMEREFGKLFNIFNNRLGNEDEEYENAVWSPLTDISETDDKYLLHMDLPGVKKEDVKLTFNNGKLVISGERKTETKEKNKTLHRVERAYGKYYRAFTLPEKIVEDDISAKFEDGTLSIEIPKAEDAKPKEIEVKIN